MNKVPRFLLIAALVCGLSACDEQSTTTMPNTVGPALDLVGEWSGNIGTGSLELVFQSSLKTLSGNVTLDLGQGPETHSFNSLRWDSPEEFRVELECEEGCRRLFTGRALNSQTLSGSYLEEHSDHGGNNFFSPWTATKKTNTPRSHRIQ